ncbi:MAG: hypothetical protein GXP15_08225 [Gammaproteobacteria bacterium]|nr:hypothetical protein [Gammaproteobacteria bacterium]
MMTLVVTASADGSAWEISGSGALQTRVFAQDGLWPDQGTSGGQFSLSGSLDMRWRSDSGDQRASFIPFGRWDGTDDERTHADLREAYWAHQGSDFEILIGIDKVFWGVAESLHLVDVINQTDLVEDIDQEDKLGQPMINLALQREWGLINVYLLPYFRERTFPGVNGRFRTPLPVDTKSAVYEPRADGKRTDFALRYSHYFGDIDVGLYYFRGIGREPLLQVSGNGQRLIPRYGLINQMGLDLQYTRNAWLWKLEAMVRDGVDELILAAVGGFEYTYYQVAESSADVGFLMEYQYDDRSTNAPFTLADDDLFIGARLALNDRQNTALLAGVVVDMHTAEAFFNIEAERRFGNDVVLELRVRAIAGGRAGVGAYAFRQDDYIQVQVARFF